MLWKPDKKSIEQTNIFKTMRQLGFNTYNEFYHYSITNKEEFWNTTINNLDIPFSKKYTSIIEDIDNVTQPNWLPNARFNIVDACFNNSDNAIAIIFQKEGGKIQKVSQKELENLVHKIANSLVAIGLEKGDFIAIDTVMTLEAVAIYLAGIKAGFPVVTIADSFTPNEIAVRLKITNPKIVFTQDVIHRVGRTLPLYQKVVDANANKVIVLKSKKESEVTLRKQDVYFDDFLIDNTDFTSVMHNPNDTITVLFSSGTTGEPKAIPWNHTTPVKAASDGYYHQNIQQNDVVAWPTNLGWMMGPWLVFATLINKACIALYYGAPIGEEFGAFVQNAKINMLGLVPSIVKHWKNTACMEGFNWNAIQCFSSTGEASNAEEYQYLSNLANKKPIIEYCGGTEIGGGYATSTLVQPNIASIFSTPTLGTEFLLLDENNKPSNKGELFIVPPIIGLSNNLLNRNHFDVYFKDTPKYKNKPLRRHGDQLEKLENNYYKAQGRTDDAMNLGGIKVSSLQIEAVINQLSFIKESAAIAVSPTNGGPSILIVYYVELNTDVSEENRYTNAKNSIRKTINPLFKLSELIKTDVLPRTASGKVMRKNLRKNYEATL